MSKKIIALVLCLACAFPLFSACKHEEGYVGPIINMYLSEMVYDFDPLYAFNNESAQKIVSLLYEPLFRIKENGKLEKALVKSYKYNVNDLNEEYILNLKFNQAYWSDGTYVSANDLVYAWKRIMDPENSNEAASLLFDIKNAREVKHGDKSIDALAVYAVGELEVEIYFEQDIDIDMFLYKLASLALVPLREDIVSKNADWAKKGSTMVASGPFIIRSTDYGMDPKVTDEAMIHKELVLERNSYYYRDRIKDEIDKSVVPYKITVNFELSKEEQYNAYQNGTLFYQSEFALSQRESVKDLVDIKDANSTHTYVFNTQALIEKAGSEEGEALFANEKVRQALSLAIDRQAIANALVFARPATGIVPYGVFAENKPAKTYRDQTADILATSANAAQAQALLAEAGVNPSDYTFAISYRDGKEAHKYIAEAVAAVWSALGFNVTAKPISAEVNDDKYFGEDPQTDICDDIFNETYFYRHIFVNRADFDTEEKYLNKVKRSVKSFEVLAVDLVAQSVDPFNVLAAFAKEYAGQGMDLSALNEDVEGDIEYALTPHISNYDSAEYSAKIEQAFAEKNYSKRLALLQEAERMLMEDMPVIPIVFNQTATLVSKELKSVKNNWLGLPDFRDTMLKDFERFAETEELEEEVPAGE